MNIIFLRFLFVLFTILVFLLAAIGGTFYIIFKGFFYLIGYVILWIFKGKYVADSFAYTVEDLLSEFFFKPIEWWFKYLEFLDSKE